MELKKLNMTDKELLEKSLWAYGNYNTEFTCMDIDNEIGVQTGVIQKIDTGRTCKQIFKELIVITVNDFDFFTHEDNIKPILYPISCLTEEITHPVTGEKFVPINELYDIFKDTYDFDALKDMPLDYPYKVVEKLKEWHVNYMLPDNLFINKNTVK